MDGGHIPAHPRQSIFIRNFLHIDSAASKSIPHARGHGFLCLSKIDKPNDIQLLTEMESWPTSKK
jgi:hypothetical protein